jgi:MFS family permease
MVAPLRAVTHGRGGRITARRDQGTIWDVFGSEALAPLRERNFRLLWFGQAVSAVGDSLVTIALAFATLSVAHSASALGLVLAVSTVAQMVALPLGGVWSDRLPRQLVMLTSDGVRAAVHSVMAVLLITGHAQLWQLVVQAVLYGFAGGFFMPAAGGLVPQTVSTARLQQANALMGLSRSITQVGGPAVAGVLVAVFGPGWVFAIDAATFVVSAVSLALIRAPRVSGSARSSFWRELKDGLEAVTSRTWYVLNLGAHALWNFGFAAFLVLGPIVAKQHLGGASAWGLISAALGAGAVLGGLIALRIKPSRPLILANLAGIPSALQLIALAVPLPTVAIMALCVFGWAGLTLLNEVWFATVPQLIPADVLARATSFDWLLSIIAMPIGFAVSGPVADHIGIQPTLVAAAAIMVVPLLLIVLVPGVRSVRRTSDGLIVAGAPTA